VRGGDLAALANADRSNAAKDARGYQLAGGSKLPVFQTYPPDFCGYDNEHHRRKNEW
jgi:hypothetical protein